MTLRRGEFAALDDVSFELRRGESLAIVGENGAGKSTLLKILYGLLKPDGGEVTIRGSVAALIELGTGFNDILTGRENIGVNATLLGYSGAALTDVTEQIIEFAELRDVIDSPVRYYSTGMLARLAFSIAAHLNPDVLLIDEVLAVGDLAFQRKCALHMRRFLADGGTLIFVSHNPYQVQALCERGVLLHAGRIAYSGSAADTVARYFVELHAKSHQAAQARDAPAEADIVVLDADVRPEGSDRVQSGAPARLTVSYRSRVEMDVLWSFTIWTADQWVCVTGATSTHPERMRPGVGTLDCRIPRLGLLAGAYAIRLGIIDAETMSTVALLGWENAPSPFRVYESPSLAANIGQQLNQLVLVDVEWE